MNLTDTEKGASRAVDSNATNTRLTGSWLIIARIVWLVLVVPSLLLCVASLLATYQQLQRACSNAVLCNNLAGALSAQGLQALSASGLSASGYAALFTTFYAINVVIWCGVGFLIFWRRSDDWLALLASFVLVMFNISSPSANNAPYVLALVYPILALPLSIVSFLGVVALFGFFLIFPNGKFVPRWIGLTLLLISIDQFFSSFPSPTSPFDANWPTWLNTLALLISFGVILYSQIYRYRHVSTFIQRQQTKWVILGVTAALGLAIGFLVLGIIFQNNTNFTSLAAQIISNIGWPFAFLLIPLSIGFSILRYRLYDIDLLINRTLVYGTLTILLTLVYVGLIFGLQYLLRGMISQNNDVAIVISTLAIAALFQPLRHRIQAIIDRRFYRRKYDAAQIVEEFSATLRNEVDLNQLREHLLTVVQETMQPSHVSLWLREPDSKLPPPVRNQPR